MNHKSLAMIGASALMSLTACAPRVPQPEPAPVVAAPPAQDLSHLLPAPALPDLPVADCRAPAAGTVSIARGQMHDSGSVRFFFAGRDESFRTPPSIYMLNTNAVLLDGRGTQRRGSHFGLWSRRTQQVEACGRRYAITFVRADDQQITFSVRPR